MLKYALLATAVTFSVPALAQAKEISPATPPVTTAQAPATAAEAMPADDAAAPAAAPAETATTAAAPADSSSQPAQTAQAAQPAAAGETGVASVVDKEFASYDKDSNGELSKTEFSAWMDALKAKSPEANKQAADPKWNAAAFAQADTDKSKAVSKTELTGFLSNATKSAS